MAQPFRSRRDNEQPNLTLVHGGRRRKQKRAVPLLRQVLTTVAVLLLLLIMWKFLPPVARHSDVQASRPAPPAFTSDLHLSGVQISRAPDGSALYLDGIVTNSGNARIGAATVDVAFRDGQGKVVASVQKPLVGMAHGGTDLLRGEFARNPIQPKEMRFFRIAVQQTPVQEVPPAWNRELPQLTIVAVKAK